MSEEQSTDQTAQPQEAMEMQQTEQGGGDAANGDAGDYDDDRKLFVGGLNWETTENDLKEYMETHGKVVSCNLKKDIETGKSRGFGFVVFEDAEAIQKVLSKSTHMLQGKNIDPKKANPKGRHTEPPIKKIYVAKVNPTTTEQQIRDYFEQYGKVEKVETPFDKEKEQRRNFVFVEFDSEETVNKVLNSGVEKHTIADEEVEIRKATPGRGRGGGRGFFRGGERGGRGGRGGYGNYGGWNDGYGNQGNYGYGNYGNGYGNYGYGSNYGYGGYGYDPNYGYGGGWGGYDQSYYGYGGGGYDYSGGWGGYDQSGQQMGQYGKAQKGGQRGTGGYRPY